MAPTSSPPAIVARASNTFGDTDAESHRTEPSANPTFVTIGWDHELPPRCRLANCPPSPRYGTPPGSSPRTVARPPAVHGPPSTTSVSNIVVDWPSLMSRRDV